ncbi:hypothetical protein H0H93_011908 [Arthromyces matolae]|nr:hypothetical protein H0H93_011908 [Arthromyces matolae]
MLETDNDMVLMFEEAYKQQPLNEELGVQTFFANVRAGHWKSAHQVATKMHKQFQDDRYLYWSVISAVLQANDSTTPAPMRSILYKLAHRIITSSPTSPYQSNDRFYLHLSILRELELYDDAHKLLDSDHGRAICSTSLSCNEIRREIWQKKGMLVEEGRLAMTRILEKTDRNWLEFLSVLDATFSFFTSSVGSSESLEKGLHEVQKTQESFKQIAENDGPKDRSAALALLELEKRARTHGLSQGLTPGRKDSGRMVYLLQEYFTQVGDKVCCFEDLKAYLDLEEKESAQWTSFLQAVPHGFATPLELQRLINSYKLQRYNLTPQEMSRELETARVVLYTERYIEGLKLGSNLPSTELQYADDLALLAANTLVNLWKLTSEEQYLLNAITLLEFALTKSKQSFQARLILIRLYRLLGAPTLALDHYRALGVKQVQNDTLSHFLLSRASTFSLASTGDLTLASECLESTQIYLSNSQEVALVAMMASFYTRLILTLLQTADFVVRAFQGERYSQIPEFITFEERLENSLQRDVVKMEHLRMRLTHEQINSDIIDMELIELKFIFDRLHHDNRDVDIIPNYQSKQSDDIFTQTNLLGRNESASFYNIPLCSIIDSKFSQFGWLRTFLKVYIRAFQQASDLDDSVEEKLLIGDRPKPNFGGESRPPLRQRLAEPFIPEELAELTPHEQFFVNFGRALAEWLEPYHDYARPPPSVVLAEAAKQTELKTGYPLKGVDLEALSRSSSPSKKDEEPPVITTAPEAVTQFFEEMNKRFAATRSNSSLVESLHVATLAQEAFLLFTVETLRFKSAAVVKANKFGALVASFKSIRADAVSVLRTISEEMVKQSEVVATQETRKIFTDACAVVIDQGIDFDFSLNLAKKVTEAQKKVLGGSDITRIFYNINHLSLEKLVADD